MMNRELVAVLLTCSLGAWAPAARSTARSGARAPAGCATTASRSNSRAAGHF